MKTKLAKKSKLIIGIITTILLLGIIGFVLWNNYFKQSKEISENKKCETCTVKYSSEQISGYDYIISEMSKPEYWGIDHMSDYFSEEELQKRLDTIPNGSGWYLSDSKTASFSRGYETVLTYNFSDFTATINDKIDLMIYDFKNNKYKRTSEDKKTIYFERDLIVGEFNDPNSDILFQSGNLANFDKTLDYKYSNIKNSMLNYAYLFELAGCPILMQPEGTLESYKNKIIHPIENYQKINMNYGDYYEARKNGTDYWGNPYADNSKINAPWELENYHYDIRELDNLQWIDDYTKVDEYVKELPDIMYEPSNQESSQAIVIFVNKDKYEWAKEGLDMYLNKTSNLFTYYNKIILEKIYGKDVTYYCDMKQMKNEILLPVETCIKDEQFPKLGFVNGAESFDAEITVFKSPQTEWKFKYEFHDIENMSFDGDIKEAFGSTEKVRIGSNTENPFSDIYKFNLLLTVDKELQEELGLR